MANNLPTHEIPPETVLGDPKTLITVPIPYYYGGCPVCHRNNGVVQIYNGEWIVCHVHRKIWLHSASLWATGTGHTQEEWARIAERFASYEEAEPVWDASVTGQPLERIREQGIVCGLAETVQGAIGRLVDYVSTRESDTYGKL
ncbi:MAG: hypothetical protein ABSH20_13615 [Tepidisphaeraceae bacterium]|jgi:hypothetical protein